MKYVVITICLFAFSGLLAFGTKQSYAKKSINSKTSYMTSSLLERFEVK